MAKEVFGIDLGTTYSCIAEISDLDKLPIVIKNSDDLQTTPSIVYYDEFDIPIVGGYAKRSMQLDPSRAIAFIKREMSNPSFKRIIGANIVSPVKISAMILKKLVDDANLSRTYRGKTPVKDVVITVPAYFGTNERELTKQAGEAAGLNVLALLNEPTAAALSYGAKRLEGREFMVYDLGGGTFDVSIMKVVDGELETISTDGNHHLGGIDWDIALVNHILSELNFEEKYDDIKDTRDGGILILAAEQCKKLLSKNEQSQIRFRYRNKLYIKNVSRQLFEQLTYSLLQKTIDVVHHAISLSTDKQLKIDEIILVGGSSYMPMVKKRLAVEFPNTPIHLDQFEPDLSVAKGAAIHAYNIVNEFGTPAAGVRLVRDLSSRSYGLGCNDCITKKPIIENLVLRTDPIIYEGSSNFRTSTENQTSIFAKIYEDTSVERKIQIDDGKLIASQSISWGYPVPQNTKVTSHIKRGNDGIVHIEVECEGKVAYFEIKPNNSLSRDELETLKNELRTMQFN